MADRGKLRQILLNLCNNAVDAMPQGGTLSLRCHGLDNWVNLDIADTGAGIPERMPVFKLAVTNKPQGSGFGLLIVRRIVEQHNGSVSYTTEYGKGTTFHIKIPCDSNPPIRTDQVPVPERQM
jgi:signal transduction histidine kinase